VLIKNTSKKTQRTLELAKRVASNSTYGKLKHGAVLIKGGNIVNVAFNKPDFTKFGNRFRNNYTCGHATTHAEIGAILGLSRSATEGATVFVVRVNRHGEYRMSKPCPMCEDVLKFVGVKKVVYTTGGNAIGEYKL
jgi:deoxycytidylate deaminase